MFYHASKTANLKKLEPRVSNHGVPLVYLSKKRENVLVYLSNAVEKYCRETGFEYTGIWEKWGSYGFDENGVLRVEEYYPNALEKTYKGEAGYIYNVENVVDSGEDIQIPDAVTSDRELEVCGCEFVPDAYEAILEAEMRGLIHIERYEELTSKKREWIEKTIKAEYEEAKDHPEYRHFLRGNFQDILLKRVLNR